MKTATELSLEEAEKTLRESAMQLRIEAFVKKWAPEDRNEAAEFHYRLIDIVRHIYDDAAARPHAQMMRMLEALPIVLPAVKP